MHHCHPKNHGLETGAGSAQAVAAVKCCHVARGTAESGPSQPSPQGLPTLCPAWPGQPPQRWGDPVGPTSAGQTLPGGHGCKRRVYSATQSWPPGGRFPLPFIETSCPSSQAPRQQAQTPSLRLGRHLLGPRRTGMPARQRARVGLARRVTLSSPSTHHWVRTLCRKAVQQDSLVPASPVCCTPRADAFLSATCPLQLHRCSLWVQQTWSWSAGEAWFGVLWAAATFTASPALHRRGLVFSLHPCKQLEKPFAACRFPVFYSRTSPASHPAQRVGY